MEGQMKKIIMLGCLLVGVMLVGTGCGSKYTEEAVTDTQTITHLNELAKENLEQYFDIQVDESANMQASATRYVPKDNAGDLTELMILLEKQEGDPVEGELYSYQIMIDPTTDAVRGLYYGLYSTAEPQTFTDEQLDEIGRNFIKEKAMIPEDQELSLLKVQKVSGAEYIQSLTYQYGEKYLLINVNIQDGKVMSFEYGS